METTAQSYFWPVFWACIFGVVLLVGLVVEALAERKWYKTVVCFRHCERAKFCGALAVIVGVLGEVIVGGIAALNEWKNNPLNRPITTVAADARIIFKSNGYSSLGESDPMWRANISFIMGTNPVGSNVLFNLSATLGDVSVVNVLKTNGGPDWEVNISFHEIHPFTSAIDGTASDRPASDFNQVESFFLDMPQLKSSGEDISAWLTNSDEVMRGSVRVLVNSSLKWNFAIPPQKHRYGMISSKKVKTANGQSGAAVMPLNLRDWTLPARFTNVVYDGK